MLSNQQLQPFQVFVRVRSSDNNKKDQESDYIQVVKKNTLRIISDPHDKLNCKHKDMRFERIFSEREDNTYIFQHTLQNHMNMIMQGYNITVLCYGMTGSGKTHTMFGRSKVENFDKGLIYQAVSEIFSRIDNRNDEKEYQLKASFFEIYNESIIDLLCTNRKEYLSIKETKDGDINIPGLKQVYIQNEAELVHLLESAQQKRQLAPTNKNLHSSRSHAIVQLELDTYLKDKQAKFSGKLILVDLAGSERCYYYSQNAVKRQYEGQNINKSLLALGQCIMMLNNSQNKPNSSQYIPYRNSKLTRILKQSLGGNSLTLFIACISKHCNTIDETENTLRYAMKACQLKSHISQTYTVDYNEQQMQNKIDQKKYQEQIDEQPADYKQIEEELRNLSYENSKLHQNLATLYNLAQKHSYQPNLLIEDAEKQIRSNLKQQHQLLDQLSQQQQESNSNSTSTALTKGNLNKSQISQIQFTPFQLNTSKINESQFQSERYSQVTDFSALRQFDYIITNRNFCNSQMSCRNESMEKIENKNQRTQSQNLYGFYSQRSSLGNNNSHILPESQRFKNPFSRNLNDITIRE